MGELRGGTGLSIQAQMEPATIKRGDSVLRRKHFN
jgi:hypothetical protein